MKKEKGIKMKVTEKQKKAPIKFLENKGYEILDKNYKTKYSYVDIVAKQDGALVFVKTVFHKDMDKGFPEDIVSSKTRKTLEQKMMDYLIKHDYVNMYVRFDRIDIMMMDDDRAFIRHHVNALGNGD